MSGIYHRDDIPEDLRGYFVRAEIGLEETPDAYVVRLVDVFREVRRVLRDDGTCWVNIGDSYNSKPIGRQVDPKRTNRDGSYSYDFKKPFFDGLQQKQLMGIPWMVAFALRADGWYLRQDIIWNKKNCMPESVADRCTKSHEYVFLLAKRERYYFDADAIREKALNTPGGRLTGSKHVSFADGSAQSGTTIDKAGAVEFRNRRSVWTLSTENCAEAHFAVMPSALADLCIRAGCPVGGTVIDPFTGSGTTGIVALRQDRRFVGCELNAEYAQMAARRIAAVEIQLALL